MHQWKCLLVCAILALGLGANAREEHQGGPGHVVETRVEVVEVPFKVEYEVSRTVGPGRIVRVAQGVKGSIRRTWEVVREHGKATSKRLVDEERIEPIHEKYHIGSAGFSTSRGAFVRTKVFEMEATAYTPDAGRGRNATGRTATGRKAAFGVVAVDPRIIPLNTMVYVEGYGLALACDVGSAIKGHRIDLCMMTRTEARQFGRRKVRVHVLTPR